MTISRTTRNEGHAHIHVNRGERRLRCRLNFGTATIPGATDAQTTAIAAAKSLTRGADITVAYRFTGQTTVAAGENADVRMGVKIVEDDADTTGGTSGVIGYTQGFNGTIAIPGTTNLTANPDTVIAGATGTFTIPGSHVPKGGSYKAILVLDDEAGDPSPPTVGDAGDVSEYYADTDGNSAFGAVAAFGTLNQRGTAWLRTNASPASISASISPLQERGQMPTITVDIGNGHALTGGKQLRVGPIRPSNPVATSFVKTLSITAAADGSAVTSASYTVDALFPADRTVHRLRVAVGPYAGQTSTVTAEQPDFWSHTDGGGNTYGSTNVSNANDKAWVYFASPAAGLTLLNSFVAEGTTDIEISGATGRRYLGKLMGTDDGREVYAVEHFASGRNIGEDDPPELVALPAAPDVEIAAGDALAYVVLAQPYFEHSIVVWPADQPPSGLSIADFEDRFVGIAQKHGRDGDMIPVYVSPYTRFEMDCDSEIHNIGSLMGLSLDGGVLSPYRLKNVSARNQACFICVRTDTSASNRVLVTIGSRLWGVSAFSRHGELSD